MTYVTVTVHIRASVTSGNCNLFLKLADITNVSNSTSLDMFYVSEKN